MKREKLRYVGNVLDSDKDGFLNKEEIVKFFTGFYQFVLFGKKNSEVDFKSPRQYGVGMAKKLFRKAAAAHYPGISLQYFCSMQKVDF